MSAPKFLIALLLVVFLAACAGPRQPDWTTGASREYPADAWLVGVGIDQDRGKAEDRARAEIAKTFQVQIRAVDHSSESHRLSRVGRMVDTEYRQEVSAELMAATDKRLAGVRIAEIWVDDRTGDCHALAVLDRQATARGLRGEIREIDERILDRMAAIEGVSSEARQLGGYLQVLTLLEQRRLLAADLRVVDPAGRIADPPYAAAEVAQRADRTASAIRIGFQIEEDSAQTVRGALVQALAAVGIYQSPAGQENLFLRGMITVENYVRGGLNWSTASARLELVDGSGTVFDSVHTAVREGSQVDGRAESLARQQLGERLAPMIVERLGRMGEGRDHVGR
jgi:hypothetical protein